MAGGCKINSHGAGIYCAGPATLSNMNITPAGATHNFNSPYSEHVTTWIETESSDNVTENLTQERCTEGKCELNK